MQRLPFLRRYKPFTNISHNRKAERPTELQLIDSHAHYDDARFDPDRDTLLASLPEAGIATVINCGSSVEASRASVALAQKYDFVYASVGVHPEYAAGFTENDLVAIRQLAQAEKVVAIGEIGLDYHYTKEEKPQQKAAFLAQLALARELSMPVIIHCREADGDCFSIIKDAGVRGVYHSYSGSVELMREILKLGFYVSFNGIATFKNAKTVQEVIKAVPADRFLIETDCPYLSPEPLRGQRNSSLHLKYTAQRIADLRGVSVEEIARQSAENTHACFGF